MRLIPLMMVVPVLAAACGGGGSKGAQATTIASTAGDFVTAGNKVCITADRRIFKIGRLTRDPKGWARTYTAAKIGIAEMQAVKPPPDRAAAFARMLRYGRALAISIQEIHTSLVKKDVSTAAAAQFAAGQLQDEVHKAAKAVGLTFCQQPLTNWPA